LGFRPLQDFSELQLEATPLPLGPEHSGIDWGADRRSPTRALIGQRTFAGTTLTWNFCVAGPITPCVKIRSQGAGCGRNSSPVSLPSPAATKCV